MVTKESIEDFVADWYKKLDMHAPMVELLPVLADKVLEMVFPEAFTKKIIELPSAPTS